MVCNKPFTNISPFSLRMLCAGLVFCFFGLLPCNAMAKQKLDQVSLQLKWKHQFQFAGYYAALEKGFYREAGLDVSIREGSINPTYLQDVLSGSATYGVGGSDILNAFLNGAPLVALATVFQHTPTVLLALGGSGIFGPQDLPGHTIATALDTEPEILRMLEAEGIDPGTVTFVPRKEGMSQLFDREVAAFAAYLTNEPWYLDKQNIHHITLAPKDYGVDFYGDVLFTSRKEVLEHLDRTDRFVKASMKGWEYAMRHPEEIATLIRTQYASEKSQEQLLYEAAVMQGLILPELVELGHMNPGRWRHMADSFYEQGHVDAANRPDITPFLFSTYTNSNQSWMYSALWFSAALLLMAIGAAVTLFFVNKRLKREVNERIQVEASLLRSRKRLRSIIDNTLAGYVFIDKNGIIQDVNDAWLLMHGYVRPSEVLGRHCTGFVAPEERERAFSLLERLLKGEEIPTGEITRLMNGGNTGVHVYSYSTVYLEGMVIGIQGFLIDVSQQKRLETDYKALIENMQEGVALHEMLVDDQGRPIDYRFLNINPAFERITGLKADDIIGSTVLEIMPDTEPYWIQTYGRVAFTGQPELIEQYSNVLDRHYSVSAYSPRVGQFAAIINDITTRKMAEEQMLRSKDKAEAANRAKGEFLANMSHELRTPLNGVFGMMQLMQQTPLTQEQKELLDTALAAGKGLMTIINDILDFSRMEAGQLLVNIQPFSLRETFHLVLENFTISAHDKGLHMELNLDGSVPEGAVGDEARLRQILFNLLGNAVKFTESGGVHIASWVVPGKPAQLKEKDFLLAIQVSDTGIGIPDNKLDTIFEPFAQADGSFTRRFQGAGLGLGIVKTLVQRLGGSICINSKSGQGTTFIVTLHMHCIEIEQHKDRPQRHAAQSVERLRVLIAEDDTVNQIVIRRLLEKNGCEVASAENGRRAFELVAAQEFDVVLMDVQMPEMDGLEATRAIREKEKTEGRPPVPIIALTAHAMSGDKELFLEAGMNHYLAKPVDLQELLATLRDFCDRETLPQATKDQKPL